MKNHLTLLFHYYISIVLARKEKNKQHRLVGAVSLIVGIDASAVILAIHAKF